MCKSIFLPLGLLVAFNLSLSACSTMSVVSEATPADVQRQQLRWPHKKSLSVEQEEEFNTDFTSLEGTYKSSMDIKDKEGSGFDISINENNIVFSVPYRNLDDFQKDEFIRKVKPGMPLKFLVEHLEAEQPHADPNTGTLHVNVHGVIVGNDNIDLFRSN